MGEAKRRKLLDANYGHGHDISNPKSRDYHAKKLFVAVDTLWTEDFLSHADFKQADKTVADWMQQQMSSFKVADRSTLARSLTYLYLEAGQWFLSELSRRRVPNLEDQNTAWIMKFRAVVKALEPWLPEDVLQQLGALLDPLPDEEIDINKQVELISEVEGRLGE